MRDFTLITYKKLVQTFIANGYSFQTQQEYIKKNNARLVLLRHDVDLKPENAYTIAKIEKKLGIQASYYFRIVDESFDETIIKQIAEMGHEIGYHYEDLSLCNGNYDAAIKHFEHHLNKFKKLYPVKTICMHGSPLSKWDNRDLWKKYDYKDFGIIAEPYFDVDFNEVFYLTDTGRRWDGDNFSVRDKVNQKDGLEKELKFRSTMDIINAAKSELLPDKIMITTHPQRWDDRFMPWAKELVWQNVKNVIKKWVYVKR